jgi:hypothetical protein
MKRKRTPVTALALLLALSFAVGLVTVALAGSDGASWTSLAARYDLSWWTVDTGGHTFSSDGDYTLGGTAGQPDAGLLTDGDYALGGGFWGGGAAAEAGHRVYLPLVLRSLEGLVLRRFP